jgi:hypothetical protein
MCLSRTSSIVYALSATLMFSSAADAATPRPASSRPKAVAAAKSPAPKKPVAPARKLQSPPTHPVKERPVTAKIANHPTSASGVAQRGPTDSLKVAGTAVRTSELASQIMSGRLDNLSSQIPTRIREQGLNQAGVNGGDIRHGGAGGSGLVAGSRVSELIGSHGGVGDVRHGGNAPDQTGSTNPFAQSGLGRLAGIRIDGVEVVRNRTGIRLGTQADLEQFSGGRAALYMDGGWEATSRTTTQGVTVITHANGATSSHFDNGTTVIRYGNGDKVAGDGDGNIVTHRTVVTDDGAVVEMDTVETADGGFFGYVTNSKGSTGTMGNTADPTPENPNDGNRDVIDYDNPGYYTNGKKIPGGTADKSGGEPVPPDLELLPPGLLAGRAMATRGSASVADCAPLPTEGARTATANTSISSFDAALKSRLSRIQVRLRDVNVK